MNLKIIILYLFLATEVPSSTTTTSTTTKETVLESSGSGGNLCNNFVNILVLIFILVLKMENLACLMMTKTMFSDCY